METATLKFTFSFHCVKFNVGAISCLLNYSHCVTACLYLCWGAHYSDVRTGCKKIPISASLVWWVRIKLQIKTVNLCRIKLQMQIHLLWQQPNVANIYLFYLLSNCDVMYRKRPQFGS